MNTNIVYGLPVVRIKMITEKVIGEKQIISNPTEMVNLLLTSVEELDREYFLVANLQINGEVININVVSQGVLDSTLVNPREVFKTSILSNSAGVILIHNHPSGDASPSNDDIKTTKRLVECGELLGIPVIDHIILANRSEYYSFADHDKL